MRAGKPSLTIGIAVFAVSGCVNAQWQPIPGTTPTVSPYRANLNCFGAVTQAGFEHPLPGPAIGLLPTLAALNTPQGQEHVAAIDAAKRACMGRQGFMPTSAYVP